MRLLLGLVLGLALIAQPGMTAAQEKPKPAGQQKDHDQKHPDDSGSGKPEAGLSGQPEPESPRAPKDDEPKRKEAQQPEAREPKRKEAPQPDVKEPKRKEAPQAEKEPAAKAPKRKEAPETGEAPEPQAQPAPEAQPAPQATSAAPVAASAAEPGVAPVSVDSGTVAADVTLRARSRRRARTPQRRARQVAGPAAAVVAATLPPPPAAARVLPLLPPHVAADTARPSSARPPLAATVERIIEVVPGPVRLALAVLFVLAVTFAAGFWLVGRRAHRLARDSANLVEDVGLLQSALLPELPERIGRAWVSAAYRPAEGLAAGGDFYDAFALPGQRTCLIVGDVTGHGRDAIPLTAAVRYTLRAYIEGGLGPRAALRATASVLAPRLEGRLVTAVAAVYDPRTGQLTFACAGHPPPVFAGEQTPVSVAAASPPLGAGVPTGRRQTTVSLPPGSAACFYTDGLTDVRVGSGRLGPERLAAQVQSLGPRDDAATVLARVVRESGEQPDDMAACLLRPMPNATRSQTERVEELEVDARDLAAGRVWRFLASCGVPEAETDAALGAVRELVGSAGHVVVEIQGSTVSVRRPEPAVLPVPLVDAG